MNEVWLIYDINDCRRIKKKNYADFMEKSKFSRTIKIEYYKQLL